MRRALKGLAIVPLLLAYIIIASAMKPFPLGAGIRRKLQLKLAALASKVLLALLGVRVHVTHKERLRGTGDRRLLVANHVSYIDILVIASIAPSVFITSMELRDTPFLGALARLGGCIFVERRKASGLRNEIAAIADVLSRGGPVALFPEGTTSNGTRVQPFKKALFDAAVAARADVLPLCLRYTHINGKPLTPATRDDVFYHGGITFFRHVPRFLSLRSVEVDVTPLKVVTTHESISRKELAAMAHDAISAAYQEPRHAADQGPRQQ